MRDDKYPLAASPAEIQRLRVQAESLSDETGYLLDRIGIESGMACLDLGCGAGGITDHLSKRVGPEGRVLGVDVEEFSLAAARAWADGLGLDNVTFKKAGIFDHDLPPESFDLVHVRYVITTIGRHAEVVGAALNLVKSGGTLVIQEADAEGIHCYPDNSAFTRLKMVLVEMFKELGGDTYAGRHIYRLLYDVGLLNIDFRACTARARSHDDLVDYLPQTVLSARDTIVNLGLMADGEMDRTIDVCRSHLADPATISTTSTVFQAWGTKS